MAKPSISNFFGNDHDQVIVGREAYLESLKNETGMDRLRRMYTLDQYGYQSKEMISITQNTFASMMGAFILGGVLKSRITFINFIENNQATKFSDHMDAKRQLQRAMFLSFGKGGWNLSWRVGIFAFTFTTLITSMSVYRGKDSVLDYFVAGGVTGGLVKMNMGLKGVIAGSCLGSALGTITGCISLLLLKASGFTMDEMRDFSKTLYDQRDTQSRNARQAYILKESTDLSDRGSDDSLFVNLKVEDTKEDTNN